MDNFLRLVQSLDPLFPIGGYTLSNGLETYTQKGIVHDKAALADFLNAQLMILPYSDLGFAAKAAQGEDFVLLDNICAASKAAREIREGSQKLCAHFLKAQAVLGEYPPLTAYREAIADGRCDGHYSVAVGLLIRELRVAAEDALRLYGYQMLSAMANHAVKLVPLRQMDGQIALAGLMPRLGEAARRAIGAAVDDLGVSGGGFELRAMQHETLPGRLYIS